MNSLGGIPDDQGALLEGEALRGRAQRLSLDILHRNVDLTVRFTDLKDLADAVVIHARLGPGLDQQAGGMVGAVAPDKLQCDPAGELSIGGQKNRTHPALAEESQRNEAIPIRNGKGGSARFDPLEWTVLQKCGIGVLDRRLPRAHRHRVVGPRDRRRPIVCWSAGLPILRGPGLLMIGFAHRPAILPNLA